MFFQMSKLFCATKVPVTNPKGFRKWSACKRRAPRKSLHPCGYVPREESRKTRVLGLPKMPKTRVVGHSSLLERHGSPNGHGTAPPQETACLNGGTASALFLLHYDTHRVGATLHFSEDRLQRRGRRSRGVSTPGGVSQLPLPGGMPDQEKCLLDVCYLSLHCQRL